MKCVLVGYGEIGRGVHQVFSRYHDIYVNDPYANQEAPEGTYDVLLVAIPYDDGFKATVRYYQRVYHPDATIIFSTVPVGTCRTLDATHCPVEGRHPNLAQSIEMSDKWLGGATDTARMFFSAFDTYETEPEATEFLKLRSTTVYGLNIEFARYSKSVCDELGIDYGLCNLWDAWYNLLYLELGESRFNRPILDPPEGEIGGHCVLPNADILAKQFPHPLVEVVRSKT